MTGRTANDSDAAGEIAGNPLDGVADFLSGNDWVFDRPAPDELTLSVMGRGGAYRLTFLWQEEYGAMQFFCECDLAVPAERRALAAQALQGVNERLWLGHFDLPAHTGLPCFRHTSLLSGWREGAGAEAAGDIVEIALAECERHRGVFALLAGPAPIDPETLKLMLADEAGEA